jgi:hypothetical protein|tara:strand:- start:458 stop:664 length:207 start_codon:yes stop_codon:yes gene_type:complete
MPKTNTPKVEVNKETIVGRATGVRGFADNETVSYGGPVDVSNYPPQGTEKSSRGRGAMVKGYKFRGVR